jgi:hypothetical protein
MVTSFGVTAMTPWEHNPALTEDRLITIGQLIRQGRNDALDRYDPTVGCDGVTAQEVGRKWLRGDSEFDSPC